MEKPTATKKCSVRPLTRWSCPHLTPRGGTGKIHSYWEDQVFRVKERKVDDSPVYQIGPDNGNGRERAVYRNLPLRCDHLPLELQSTQPPLKLRNVQKPARRKRSLHHGQHQTAAQRMTTATSSGIFGPVERGSRVRCSWIMRQHLSGLSRIPHLR